MSERFANIEDNAWIALEFDEQLPAGTYYFEQSKTDGTIGWWSPTDNIVNGGRRTKTANRSMVTAHFASGRPLVRSLAARAH